MNRDIRVPLSVKKIQAIYDSLSLLYDSFTRYEIMAKKKALEIAKVKRGFKILEVGFGTGKILMEFAKKVGDTGKVHGLDVSPKMTNKTKKIIEDHHLTQRVDLVIGSIKEMPFHDSNFNVVYASYMFDLIDTPEIPEALSEFKRVLKPGGQVVLVSLSKGSNWYDNMKLYEWIYKLEPSLLGGCRPVLLKPYLKELGFGDINRQFMHVGFIMPTEIIWAKKVNSTRAKS